MQDSFQREIEYLRISLTDQCNLRCTYCMPEEDCASMLPEKILSFEQILAVVRAAVSIDIHKFRLTGGEPLVRPHVVELVRDMACIEGVKTLSMTTNGLLLTPIAQDLKNAGLQSVNISMDTLDPDYYRLVTRGGDLSKVLTAIDASLEAGLVVKINMVMMNERSVRELPLMKEFAQQKGVSVQTIAQYHLDQMKTDNHSFDRPQACRLCNRIRLLADGRIRTCLHSDDDHEIDFSDIVSSLKEAIKSKPKHGTFSSNSNVNFVGG
ncbi:MAG: GTP 3',8-cyclase MoaA [Brevinema sp.]